MQTNRAVVVGAGLAGCEAAYQLAKRGIEVELYEMKPVRFSPAHKSEALCELVCSNSLRSDRIENAAGLLKEELRALDSLVIRCADETRVPAGGALAVDREGFARRVTEEICALPNITLRRLEVASLPDAPAIIATGPLTDGPLFAGISALVGESLHFYDAAAPIVSYDSLDHGKIFRASRYGRGEDYLNAPMTRAEYEAFWTALVHAETAKLHDFETPRVFEGCMPVEVMAKRGPLTLAYGPLKPVGLSQDGARPYAVVQLRQDNAEGTLYNIVGFQTNLLFSEQRRVFGMIPGLENAEFVRYGVMHKNSFLPANVLTPHYELKARPGLYFAGQITGVEGYIESTASGLAAGVALASRLAGRDAPAFPRDTAIGALAHYVSNYTGSDFQPMNVNFGIMDHHGIHVRNKQERYRLMAEKSLAIVKELKTDA